jgi:hypothetical protein
MAAPNAFNGMVVEGRNLIVIEVPLKTDHAASKVVVAAALALAVAFEKLML